MSHTSSNKNEQYIFFSKLHFVFWILLCNVNKVKSKERNKCILAPYYDLFLVSSTTSLGQIDVNEENQVHKEFSDALFCLFFCKNKCKLVKNVLLKKEKKKSNLTSRTNHSQKRVKCKDTVSAHFR